MFARMHNELVKLVGTSKTWCDFQTYRAATGDIDLYLGTKITSLVAILVTPNTGPRD